MEKGRTRKLPLGQRSWIFRYPRAFQVTFTTLGVAVFFSKPLYDIFFLERIEPDYTEPPTTFLYTEEPEN